MDGAATVTLWCPRCLRPVGDAATCPGCALPQHGPDVARLRVVVHRLYQLGERQRALAAESGALERERDRLLETVAGGSAAAVSRPPGEWRPAVVRGVLLGLGSLLVALAALIFAVVTWVRLGDLGRAGLLAGATLAAGAAAAAAHRRLPATAEALGGLALAVLLVDWYALRRAGVGEGVAATTWWALGTGIAAAVAAGAGRWLAFQRPAAAALAQVAGLLVVLELASAPWTVAAGLALLAAAATGLAARLSRVEGWGRAVATLLAGAAVLELVAVLGVLLGPWPGADLAAATGPALALAAVALAPAVARAAVARAPAAGHALVAASAGALLGAAGTLLAAGWSGWWLASAVAVLGAAVVAAGRFLPWSLRLGTTLAAGVTLAAGLAGLAEPVLWALLGPAGWLGDPWTARLADPARAALPRRWWAGDAPGGGWPAVVGLLATAGAALAAGSGGRSPAVAGWRAAGAAAAVAAVAVLPLAAGWPVGAALVLVAAAALAAGAGAVLLDRRAGSVRPVAVLAGGGATLLALAVCWALAAEAGTLGFLAVVLPTAVAGAGASRGDRLRRGWAAVAAGAAAGAAAAVVAGNGGDAAQAGFAVVLAGGLVLVAGTRWRPGTAEGVAAELCGLAALALGVALTVPAPDVAPPGPLWPAMPGPRWLAASLTAAVPPLALAALGRPRPRRRGYRWATAAAATAAIWAWLAVAGVTLPEAYLLPAAAVALAAGVAARRGPEPPGSWAAYGPGLAIALAPSLVLAVDGDGLARPLLLGAGALAAVLAGARGRLQAPLVLGAVALVVLAADAALPVAARLPRWVSVGGTGLLLLWLGATAERRLARLRDLRRQLTELEPGAGVPGPG